MNARNKRKSEALIHPFQPIADDNSKVLVLGSFPSVKSRETMFYYGHPQNRFWRVLAALFGEQVPQSVDGKTALLLKHHVALWDVVSACDILSSADSALTPLTFSDIASLLRKIQIRRVFANGQKAGMLYRRHLEKETGMSITILPSTSPANAAWQLERLITAWKPVGDAAGKQAVSGEEHL
ncbi:MAG: DNA-deoxyinosine glycosylase [Bacillota bacterium]